MTLNKIFYIILFVLFSVQAFSQPVLKIEGKVAGQVNGIARLVDLKGVTVMETPMDKGRFLLEKACDPGIYRLEIGKYMIEAFFDAKPVTVSGYVDPDNENACELNINGLQENERLMAIHSNIAGEIKRQQDKLRNSGSQDEWITKMVQGDMDKAELAVREIRKGTSPAFEAALAYLNRGTFYESASVLYEALTEEGKTSACGRLLKKYMESKRWLANGELAPNFTLQDDSGKKISLNDLRGRVVVVDFWASWCGSCRDEMQYLKKIYPDYKGKKVEFVSISMDDTLEKWKATAAEEQIPWISLWESAGFWKSELKEKYDFCQIPYVIVIDDQGKIAGKNLRRLALVKRLNELVK